MRDRALKRQDGGDVVHMPGIACADTRGLEAKVVIAMRLLRRATRTHLVDLPGHMVVRPQPCLAKGCNRRFAK